MEISAEILMVIGGLVVIGAIVYWQRNRKASVGDGGKNSKGQRQK